LLQKFLWPGAYLGGGGGGGGYQNPPRAPHPAPPEGFLSPNLSFPIFGRVLPPPRGGGGGRGQGRGEHFHFGAHFALNDLGRHRGGAKSITLKIRTRVWINLFGRGALGSTFFLFRGDPPRGGFVGGGRGTKVFWPPQPPPLAYRGGFLFPGFSTTPGEGGLNRICYKKTGWASQIVKQVRVRGVPNIRGEKGFGGGGGVFKTGRGFGGLILAD